MVDWLFLLPLLGLRIVILSLKGSFQLVDVRAFLE
jgi:hypothetical protein